MPDTENTNTNAIAIANITNTVTNPNIDSKDGITLKKTINVNVNKNCQDTIIISDGENDGNRVITQTQFSSGIPNNNVHDAQIIHNNMNNLCLNKNTNINKSPEIPNSLGLMSVLPYKQQSSVIHHGSIRGIRLIKSNQDKNKKNDNNVNNVNKANNAINWNRQN